MVTEIPITRPGKWITNLPVPLAQRIARAFDAPIEYQSTCFEPGVSIGVALYPEHGENADELLRNADAMAVEINHCCG